MKRSEALKSLSHDHHQALFLALKLTRAEQVEPGASELIEFWQREGKVHFRVEEEVLLPLSPLEGPSVEPMVARMLDEHLSIRRQVARVEAREAGLEEIRQVGQALRDHVRFEERVLFPALEQRAGEEELERIAAAVREAEAA